MASLFISDLHLHESRPLITRAFFQFLQNQAQGIDALYILGDFFDAWIGDDDDAPLNAEVAAALRSLSTQGTQVFLMHGNRDFLMGEQFAKAAGATLIAENTVVDLYGTPTLLLHGDGLCTDDAPYMAFRQQVRSPQWQAQILAQPLAARRALAAQLRQQSQAMNSLKAEDIMDVNADAVVTALNTAKVSRMIHGHTHRPARHSLSLGNHIAERIVLGDWHDQGWVLYADAQGLELRHWPIAEE